MVLARRADAVTPNAVNLQVLGDHLLVPRPYGPRMRMHDAIAVMWQVLRVAANR